MYSTRIVVRVLYRKTKNLLENDLLFFRFFLRFTFGKRAFRKTRWSVPNTDRLNPVFQEHNKFASTKRIGSRRAFYTVQRVIVRMNYNFRIRVTTDSTRIRITRSNEYTHLDRSTFSVRRFLSFSPSGYANVTKTVDRRRQLLRTIYVRKRHPTIKHVV